MNISVCVIDLSKSFHVRGGAADNLRVITDYTRKRQQNTRCQLSDNSRESTGLCTVALLTLWQEDHMTGRGQQT